MKTVKSSALPSTWMYALRLVVEVSPYYKLRGLPADCHIISNFQTLALSFDSQWFTNLREIPAIHGIYFDGSRQKAPSN